MFFKFKATERAQDQEDLLGILGVLEKRRP